MTKFFVFLIWQLVFISNVWADKVAIASAHPLATEAGFMVLQQGGNVFDAAVAVSAALAVVEPSSSGLGGGAYWLLHQSTGQEVMIDAREKAPLAAHKTMYLNKDGQVIKNLSLDGALAAAIPGMPAGLVHLAKHYGRLPLAQSLAPAISYAENGFAVGNKYVRLLKLRANVLKQYPSSQAIFLSKGIVPYSILKQPDLAKTLRQLAEYGHDGFYRGSVAEELVSSVRHAGGIWTLADLQRYQVRERVPIKGHYHGMTITSAAPSSSGGTVLMETLNILSGYNLAQYDTLTRKHLIVEAMRRAYQDRALYLGDGDFVSLPLVELLNPDYATQLRKSIRFNQATPSHWLANKALIKQGTDTTHFSIIDDQGNRVAATLSTNFPFGSGFVAGNTGVLLNDEMDDFVTSNAGNGYGLVGGIANSILPEKRMLSSMTPTFLEDKQRIAVVGTPGGSRIISMVLLATLDFAEGHPPDSWVKLPRYHHQFMPDVIEYEANALTEYEQQGLLSKGHQLKAITQGYGDMQAVMFDKQTHTLTAASDPRGEGRAMIQTIH